MSEPGFIGLEERITTKSTKNTERKLLIILKIYQSEKYCLPGADRVQKSPPSPPQEGNFKPRFP